MPDNAVSNELIYEVVKSIQQQISIVREDLEQMKPRLLSIEQRLSRVHTDMAH